MWAEFFKVKNLERITGDFGQFVNLSEPQNMNKTSTTKSFNSRIVALSMILGLAVFLISGCSVSLTTGNENTKPNTNSAANNTTVSNANSSTPVNTNTVAASNSTAANGDSSKTEQKANTNVAGKPSDSASGETGDCTVKADNAEFFIEATEKTVKLKKGTQIQYVMFGNQGIAVVKAQIDGKWVRGEIQDELLDCPDDSAKK